MKKDTKWRLRDSEGKEYIIIDSEKVDMQEELNKMIAKQMKEIERLHNIIKKVREYIESNFDKSGVCVSGSDLPYSYIDELLEILDKEKE